MVDPTLPGNLRSLGYARTFTEIVKLSQGSRLSRPRMIMLIQPLRRDAPADTRLGCGHTPHYDTTTIHWHPKTLLWRYRPYEPEMNWRQ